MISRRVRFLIVGAHALAAHGRPRATDDLDVLIDPTKANTARLAAALDDFGFPAFAQRAGELASGERMATIGRPPLRIDVMNTITGVSFREAWRGRIEAEIDGLRLPFLGRAELEKNKAASARPKDLLDLELIREADDD